MSILFFGLHYYVYVKIWNRHIFGENGINCTVTLKNQERKDTVMEESYICEHDKHRRIGYAYVPFQRLGKLYDPETALRAGTIFPELNITLDEYERGLYNGT